MKTVTISGASDDLIELEGDIREEFTAFTEVGEQEYDGGFLSFGDGTVLSIEYGARGMWRINRLATGTATYEKKEATNPDGDYSDRVTLTGDLRWVVFGKDVAILKP